MSGKKADKTTSSSNNNPPQNPITIHHNQDIIPWGAHREMNLSSLSQQQEPYKTPPHLAFLCPKKGSKKRRHH